MTCDIPRVKALCPAPLWCIPSSRCRAELITQTLNLTYEHPFYSSIGHHYWVQLIISFLSDRRRRLTTGQTLTLTARCWEGDSMGRCLNEMGRAPLAWQLSLPTPSVCRPFPPFFSCLTRCLAIGWDTGRPLFICSPKGPAAFQGIDRKDSEGLSEMITQDEGGEGRGGRMGSKRKRSQVTAVTLSSCCRLWPNTTRAWRW